MSDSNAANAPRGQQLLRTLAMPRDANANGDIFGGWIMAQMDLAAGILAKDICRSRTTTVAVDKIVFEHPVNVGDVVCCYGDCARIGRTSMTLEVEVWVRREYMDPAAKRHRVTRAEFTYVAIDADGRPHPVKRASNPPPA